MGSLQRRQDGSNPVDHILQLDALLLNLVLDIL